MFDKNWSFIYLFTKGVTRSSYVTSSSTVLNFLERTSFIKLLIRSISVLHTYFLNAAPASEQCQMTKPLFTSVFRAMIHLFVLYRAKFRNFTSILRQQCIVVITVASLICNLVTMDRYHATGSPLSWRCPALLSCYRISTNRYT